MAVIDTPTVLSRPVAASEPKKIVPIKWWAGFGVIAIAIQAYAFFDWIFLSGNFNATDPGPDPIPTNISVGIWAFQAIGLTCGIVGLYYFFIRPWRKKIPLGLDSYMVAGLYLVFWQDPILNYFQNWATYNAGVYDFGSWASSIPGWLAPNSHNMSAPLFFLLPVYGIIAFTFSSLVALTMKRARARYPEMGNLGIVSIGFAVCSVIVFIVETIFLRFGLYAYPGAIRSLSLWSGKYYQYPLYEWMTFTAAWTAWGSMIYFRNDKGESMAERGLEELRTKTDKKLNWLRFLAVTGMINVAFFMVYNLPLQPFALHADPWPDEILESRSYMLNEMCGPGTDFACSGPNIPVPREGGWYVDLEGNLVKPETALVEGADEAATGVLVEDDEASE